MNADETENKSEVSFVLNFNYMSDWTQEEYDSKLGLYWDDDEYGLDQVEDDQAFKQAVSFFNNFKGDLDQSNWPYSKQTKQEKDFTNLVEGKPKEIIDWGNFKTEMLKLNKPKAF